MENVGVISTNINPKKIIKDEEGDEDFHEMYFSNDYDINKLKEIFDEVGPCDTGDLLVLDDHERNFGIYIIIKDTNNNMYITQFSFEMLYISNDYIDYGFLLPVRTYKQCLGGAYVYYQPVLIDILLIKCENLTEKCKGWYIYVYNDMLDMIEKYDDPDLKYAYRIFNEGVNLLLQYINIHTLEIYDGESIILSPPII